MPITTGTGLQWGDEAKGALINRISEEMDGAGNVNGGANAGNAVVINGVKRTISQFPTLRPGKLMVIGAHAVVSPHALLQEAELLEKAGSPVGNRLKIFASATVIDPAKQIADLALMQCIGTTGSGIGTAYAGKAERMILGERVNISAGDTALNPALCEKIAKQNWKRTIDILHALGVTDDELEDLYKGKFGRPEAAMDNFLSALPKVASYVEHDPLWVRDQSRKGIKWLLKCSQGGALDLQFGTAPYQTSSYVNTNMALFSVGCGPEDLEESWGVGKGTITRVGFGTFPTEMGGQQSMKHCMAQNGNLNNRTNEKEQHGGKIEEYLRSGDPFLQSVAIRIQTGEYGERTGRPRRIGYQDAVVLRTFARLNQVRKLFISKLDCLRYYGDQIPLCTAYELPDGSRINYMPSTEDMLASVKPVYEYFDGSQEDLRGIRDPKKLPKGIRKMLGRMSELAEAPIVMGGTGPDDSEYMIFDGDDAINGAA